MPDPQSDPGDDEWLLMRIHPGKWASAFGRPQTGTMKVDLRKEVGLSCYREAFCTADEVLARFASKDSGSLLLTGELRRLGLFVVTAVDPADAEIGRWHAEIRAGSPAGGVQIGKSQRIRIVQAIADDLERRCVVFPKATLGGR